MFSVHWLMMSWVTCTVITLVSLSTPDAVVWHHILECKLTCVLPTQLLLHLVFKVEVEEKADMRRRRGSVKSNSNRRRTDALSLISLPLRIQNVALYSCKRGRDLSSKIHMSVWKWWQHQAQIQYVHILYISTLNNKLV